MRNASTNSRIERVGAFEAPGGYTDDDVTEVSERTAGVSSASVLATDVQDTGAHHAIGDIRIVLIIRLSPQVSVPLSTQLLVDDVDVNVHKLLRTGASVLKFIRMVCCY